MSTAEIYRERMNRWADELTRVPDHKFDLDTWAEGVRNGCATVACAAGWLPSFFPLEWVMRGYRPALRRDWSGMGVRDSLQAFFGITDDEADSIIFSENYEFAEPTTLQVAERIREVCANRFGHDG